MLSVADLRRIFTEANVCAFARVVREGESSQTDNAYRMRYNGPHGPPALFEDTYTHPQIFVDTGRGTKSSAAGAYQFTWTTWRDEILANWPELTFSPPDQDAAYVGLLSRTGRALDYVQAGMLAQAIAACRNRWTSLPGAAENHARNDWARARAVFEQYGGRASTAALPQPDASHETAPPASVIMPTGDAAPAGLSTEAGNAPAPDFAVTQPPAPIEERGVPFTPPKEPAMLPALLTALLPSVLQLFAPRAQAQLARVTGAPPEVAQAFTKDVFAALTEATGKTDPVEAVAAIKAAPPATVKQVEDAALDSLDRLLPLLDRAQQYQREEWEAEERSRAAADERARTDGKDQDTVLTWAIVLLAGAVLTALGAGVAWLAATGKPYGELLALFGAGAGAIWTKFSTRYDHRYGSSRSSAAKDATINRIAAERRP